MILYNLRLAWKSLLRTPGLSLVTLAAIALGVAVSTSCVTIHHLLAADLLPEHSADLHYVRLDSWNPERPWRSNHPERPPDQITYRDAMALMEADPEGGPTRKTAMYAAEMIVRPNGGAAEGASPFTAAARLCFRDFFPMFDVPFLYGGPWDRETDDSPEAVVVLDNATNLRLFGGDDSIGERVRLGRRDFTVVGVLAPWRPSTRFYDIQTGAQNAPEQLFLPFRLGADMELPSDGNINNWSDGGDTWAENLESEAIWIQMWVELPTAAHRAAFQAHVDAYTESQRALGRFQRPTNNWLQPMMEWLEEGEAVPAEARTFTLISLLFLTLCSINLIGLLLGKFLARAPEVGVRRALGASRMAIFVQHLVECQLLGVLGGALGLGGAALALRVLNRWFEDTAFHLDGSMALVGLALALVAGSLAGIYPAWRIGAVVPAEHLKA